MSYTKIFKVIGVEGHKLTRDPHTLKKLVDGTDFKAHLKNTMKSWDITTDNSYAIYLADTGRSNIIAIDFDGLKGDKHFHTMLELDPGCKYIAKGLGKGGGHFIYKEGNTRLLDSIITSANGCKIDSMDLQRGRKLILLATPGNETKQLLTPQLTSYDELTTMPLGVQAYLTSIYLEGRTKDAADTTQVNTGIHQDSKLYYIVRAALSNPDTYHHQLFTILTTKKYKQIMGRDPKHPEMPYIPDNLPLDESGNEYMVSIATILGMDPSIDADTFLQCMHYVNSMFSEPMENSEIDTIVTYITSGNSKIGSETVWRYNPDWQKQGFIYTEHSGVSHEVFIYNNKGVNSFIDHNHITNRIEYYNTAGAMLDNISSVSPTKSSKERLLQRSQKVTIVSTPEKGLGLHKGEYDSEFNIYRRTEEQEILMDPSIYTEYRYPETTVKFLENSMGYKRCHEFFLPFLKRKLTTREFSPLILVLYGPPHSGKSAVVNGILRPLTKGRNISLTPEIATEKFDDWKLNKDIILIDEAHNTRSDYLTKMVQTMNTISGSDVLTGIRAMQSSASSDEHKNTITIVVTCNKVVTLSTEPQDRRLVIMRSRMSASEALGLGNDEIQVRLTRESKDFAYYLATEVKLLQKELYTNNSWLKDEDYAEFQNGALPFSTAITTAIDNGDFSSFCELLMDYKITHNDILASSQLVGDHVQIRLYNSNEQAALYPSLLNEVNIDSKMMMKEMMTLRNSQVRRVDAEKGKRTNNKKTVAIFQLSQLPDDFRDELIGLAKGIEPIIGEGEINLV